MSTHGCIRVVGEGFPKGILLHTTHTGQDIPNVVKECPVIILSQRTYIDTEQKLMIAIKSDGSLGDWLFYPQCVCSLLIAARPMFLCHVSSNEKKHLPEWSGADNPWILAINDSCWYLTNPETKEIEKIDPWDVIRKKL